MRLEKLFFKKIMLKQKFPLKGNFKYGERFSHYVNFVV